MRRYAVIAILTFAPGLWPAGNKLTWEDRVELTRGLTAEYATVKALLPRSSRALVFDAAGGYDKNQWSEIARQSGPAARSGDLVQITKVEIGDDKLVLQINGGFKGGRKWAWAGGRRYGGIAIRMRRAGRRSRFCSTSRSSPSRPRRSRKCWRPCWTSKNTA